MKPRAPLVWPRAPKDAVILRSLAPAAAEAKSGSPTPAFDGAQIWPTGNLAPVYMRLREAADGGGGAGSWEFLIEPGGSTGVIRRGVGSPGGPALDEMRFAVVEGGERWVGLEIAGAAPHQRFMFLRFGGADDLGRLAALLAWRGKVRSGVLSRVILKKAPARSSAPQE